jgi:hypothetical protein
MKHRFSGYVIAAKSSSAEIALTHFKSIVCIATVAAIGLMGSIQAHAQATPAQAQYCQSMTPTNLSKLTAALEAARVSSFDAASASDLNPYALSTYPINYVEKAQNTWQNLTAFFNQSENTAYLSHYVTNISVAGQIGGEVQIGVMQELIHARWWARAFAYNWSYNVQPAVPEITNAYLDAHTKIQAAIDLIEAIGFNATSCALNQTQPDNPTRNVLTRVVTSLD